MPPLPAMTEVVARFSPTTRPSRSQPALDDGSQDPPNQPQTGRPPPAKEEIATAIILVMCGSTGVPPRETTEVDEETAGAARNPPAIVYNSVSREPRTQPLPRWIPRCERKVRRPRSAGPLPGDVTNGGEGRVRTGGRGKGRWWPRDAARRWPYGVGRGRGPW